MKLRRDFYLFLPLLLVYIETGSTSGDNAALFTITTATSTTFSRTYNVKVTFIECSNPLL